jgi:hypothetical protein
MKDEAHSSAEQVKRTSKTNHEKEPDDESCPALFHANSSAAVLWLRLFFAHGVFDNFLFDGLF